MNRGLRNELALVAGLTSAGLALTRYRKSATVLATLALGLRLLPSKPDLSFRNSSVVITGGSRGLGLALAEEFLNEGAQVSLLARDEAELQRARKILKEKTGIEAFVQVCDVTSPTQLSKAFSEVHSQFGEINILVNNAGAVIAAPLEAMETEDFVALMRVHFFAVESAFSMLIPYFKEKGEGHFVNISSIGGKIPVPHLSAYSASKFALAGYSQTCAAELSQHGIKVTTIYPGLMRTGSPIQGLFKGDSEKEYGWFSASDQIPGLSVSARSAAKKILEAVRDGRTELVISAPAKLATTAYSLFPEIFTKVMDLINRSLPKNTSKESHTGAFSKKWIESKFKPLKTEREKLQAEYNQKETYF